MPLPTATTSPLQTLSTHSRDLGPEPPALSQLLQGTAVLCCAGRTRVSMFQAVSLCPDSHPFLPDCSLRIGSQLIRSSTRPTTTQIQANPTTTPYKYRGTCGPPMA